jgi:hypothetical protein
MRQYIGIEVGFAHGVFVAPHTELMRGYYPKPDKLECSNDEGSCKSWPVAALRRDKVERKNAPDEDNGKDISIQYGIFGPLAIGGVHHPCRMKNEHWV